MNNFICGGEKYILGGPNGDSIGLPVEIAGLPETIAVEGYTLLRRSAFHVTLVATGEIARKHNVTNTNFTDEVVQLFCEYIAEHPVELNNFRDEYRFVAEGERRSVVRMCDIANLDQFFELLNAHYSLQLQHPPTHATLYTLQLDQGIFLTDGDDIKQLTKVIPNPFFENSDVFVAPSKINGLGLFAKRDFKEGEVVTSWNVVRTVPKEEVPSLSAEDRKYLSQIDGEYVIVGEPARFVNHSDTPNTRAEGGHDIALRDIAAGEEITADYRAEGAPLDF